MWGSREDMGCDAIILVRVIESGMAAHENNPYKMLIPTLLRF